MNFIIDGTEWDLPCTVERTAEIQASDISGLLLDKNYFNDVIATYLQYDVRIEVPFGREQEYNDLYDSFLIAPVGMHQFLLPYVGGMVEVSGRIENVSDVFVRHVERDPRTNQKKEVFHWKGISFSVISNNPIKKVVDSDISYGTVRTSYQNVDGTIVTMGVNFPSESTVSVGEVYVYGANGWEILPDADDYQY